MENMPKNEQSLLGDIPFAQPSLERAHEISRRVVDAGFEWNGIEGVWNKVAEEMGEFKAATPGTHDAEVEFGDILFSLVNVARWNGIDAERALHATCDKFCKRWKFMEQAAAKMGCTVDELDVAGQEQLWQRAKDAERNNAL